MDKLIALNSFVTEVEQYAKESLNYKRTAQLIFAYNRFLNQPIIEEMFMADNALFPKCNKNFSSDNFKIVNDLVGKLDDYDSRNEKFGWNDDIS